MKKLIYLFCLLTFLTFSVSAHAEFVYKVVPAYGTTAAYIASTATTGSTFTVNNATNSATFPTSNFYVVIYSAICSTADTCVKKEKVLISARSGNTFTISARAQGSTTAQAWNISSNIKEITTSGGGGSGAVSSVFGRIGDVVATSGDYTTDLVTEGTTNLYFTNARARAAVNANPPLTYNSTSGLFGCQTASGSQAGCLSSTDWTNFNSKQTSLTFSQSLLNTGNIVSLLNDATTPGSYYCYSTDVSGTKGWYSCSTGTSGIGGSVGSLDKAVPRAMGLGGLTLQGSAVTIDDNGSPNIPTGQHYKVGSVNLAYSDVGAAPLVHTQAWSTITGTPTTASGYGLTNVVLTSQTINGYSLTGNINLGAADIGLGALTNDLQLKASQLVTSVGTPGSDTNVPSEKAVRTLFTGITGTGTVTSVDMTVPTGFAVSGNPITGSGTLALTISSQAAYKVLAAGSTAGVPVFQLLTAAHIPNISESQVSNLTTDLGNKQPLNANLTTLAGLTPVAGTVVIGNSTPAFSVSSFTLAAPGAASAVLYSDGSGNWIRQPNPVFGSGSAYAVAYWSGSTNIGYINSLGTTGQVLTSNGSGAAPSWQNPSGGGSSTFGTLLSGTNTQAAMVCGAGCSISTTSTGTNTATNLSIASQGQGAILYYNGTQWTQLPAGASGCFLRTQGAGFNPVWAVVSGSGTINSGATGQLAIYTGSGTVVGPTTLTFPTTINAGDILYGSGSNAVGVIAKGANNTIFGVNNSGTQGYISQFASDDSAYQFYNATDSTKQGQFTLAGLTTGQNRIIGWPDVGGTPTMATRSGAWTTNDCVKYSGGNFVDAGAACGSGSGGGASTSDYFIVTQTAADLPNSTNVGGLATGFLVNTTSAGAGTITAYGGSSCTNQFPRSMSAVGVFGCASVSLTGDVAGILPVANGGTNNAYFTVSGPASSAKTYTFPNASATVLTESNTTSANPQFAGLGIGTAAVSGKITVASVDGSNSIKMSNNTTYTCATSEDSFGFAGNAAFMCQNGVKSSIGSGGGGASSADHYITTQTDVDLANSFSLGSIGTSPALLVNTVTGGVGALTAYGGASCTNKAMTALSVAGAATCNTITSSYVDTTVAVTGADINTSSQVTVTHLASALPVAQGGTGITDLTFKGSTHAVATTTGSYTTNDCIKVDSSGNFIDAGSACGAGGSTTYPSGSGFSIVSSGTSWGTTLADPLLPSHGGTGVANNAASTLTISGAYGITLTVGGTTSLTLPTSGTVATGTSTTDYWPYWSSANALTGVSIAASKVICSDSSKHPIACTNLSDVGYLPLAGGTLSGSVVVGNGLALETDTTNAHTFTLSGYGSGGYTPVLTVTNVNASTPTLTANVPLIISGSVGIADFTEGTCYVSGSNIDRICAASSGHRLQISNNQGNLSNIMLASDVPSRTGYITFTHPSRADGAGAVIQSDYTSAYYGEALMDGGATCSGNWVEYRTIVPSDIDTSQDLTVVRWEFVLSGADASTTQQYQISMASVANSGSYSSPTLGQSVNLNFSGDSGGAANMVESVSNITLTSWKSNVTAGQLWVIRVCRNANDPTYDTSIVASYSGPLTISYQKVSQ